MKMQLHSSLQQVLRGQDPGDLLPVLPRRRRPLPVLFRGLRGPQPLLQPQVLGLRIWRRAAQAGGRVGREGGVHWKRHLGGGAGEGGAAQGGTGQGEVLTKKRFF